MAKDKKQMDGKDPCWDNYEMVGTKKKNGKTVPNCVPKKEQMDELSNEKLSQYKKKAGEQASAADKSGDTKKADKRFSGIMKATNKQFDNDAKKYKKEELDMEFVTILEEGVSDSVLSRMRAEYAKLETIDPSSASYKKLISMLDGLETKDLDTLAKSKIKFVSGLAQNRVMRRKKLGEGWDEMMKAQKERQEKKPNGGAGKKEGSRYGGSKQKDVKEEIEELDELSRDTLMSYKHKAERSVPEDEKEYKKRSKGIEKAEKKLTKEEIEELDELSSTTLKSYRDKAISKLNSKTATQKRTDNIVKADKKAYRKDMEDYYKKWQKNEELELDEAAKAKTVDALIATMVKGGHNQKDSEKVAKKHFDYLQKVYPTASLSKWMEIAWSLDEEVDYIEEMTQGKEYTQAQLQKKIQSGNWEATHDIKPGKHVEMRHHTGKRVIVQVKEDVDQLDELSKSTLGSYKVQAGGQAQTHSTAAQNSNDPKKIQSHSAKAQKRLVGASKAHQKMMKKEELELDEAFNVFHDENYQMWTPELLSAAKKNKDKIVAIAGLNGKNMPEYLLVALNAHDKSLVSGIKLKAGEGIYRYYSRSTIAGGMSPFIKANLEKGLFYFLDQASSSGETEEIKFEAKAEKARYVRIVGNSVSESRTYRNLIRGLEERYLDDMESKDDIQEAKKKSFKKMKSEASGEDSSSVAEGKPLSGKQEPIEMNPKIDGIN